MFTLQTEGPAQDYVDRYVSTNGYDKADNDYFLSQITVDGSLIICCDDDCYMPFYEAMQADFDNDGIILINNHKPRARGKGNGIVRTRRIK